MRGNKVWCGVYSKKPCCSYKQFMSSAKMTDLVLTAHWKHKNQSLDELLVPSGSSSSSPSSLFAGVTGLAVFEAGIMPS